MTINKSIELVVAREACFSSMSNDPSAIILKILQKHYRSAIITYISEIKDLEKLSLRSPDLVFLTVKRIPINRRQKQNTVWGV